ncbi:MAG TPA: phosphate acyltransferase PlsX [Bacteroidia bacterium]|nr:phosphate acyltransferase PlsX [Bacteroidia bacterium]
MKIGLDVMGGDFAPQATISGAVLARKELPAEVKIVLIGDEKIIFSELQSQQANPNDFEIVHAAEVIGMGEHPTKAFAQKTNSTIAVGFKLLKEKKINVFAGSGNTGAMLVGAMYTVKAIEGVLRPCITSILPKENGKVGLILDVGANADCKPDTLYQFGILGSVYAKNVFEINNPRVALLNIGEEEEKGNLATQAAHQLMKDSKEINFIGNIEGRDVFNDKADIIVCDGFTGNVVLKQAEAFYSLIKRRGWKDDYFDRFNYENYGGTPILGINSDVLIGHGISNPVAIKNMLLLSKNVVEANLSEKIKQAFNHD